MKEPQGVLRLGYVIGKPIIEREGMVATNAPGKQCGSHGRTDESTQGGQHLTQTVDFASEVGEGAVVDQHVWSGEVNETGEDAAHRGDEDDGPLERHGHGVGEGDAGIDDQK